MFLNSMKDGIYYQMYLNNLEGMILNLNRVVCWNTVFNIPYSKCALMVKKVEVTPLHWVE